MRVPPSSWVSPRGSLDCPQPLVLGKETSLPGFRASRYNREAQLSWVRGVPSMLEVYNPPDDQARGLLNSRTCPGAFAPQPRRWAHPSTRASKESLCFSTGEELPLVALELLFLMCYTFCVLWALLAGVAWMSQIQQRDGWHGAPFQLNTWLVLAEHPLRGEKYSGRFQRSWLGMLGQDGPVVR